MKQIKLAFCTLTIRIVLVIVPLKPYNYFTKMCLEYNIVNRGVESTDTFNIIDNQLEP